MPTTTLQLQIGLQHRVAPGAESAPLRPPPETFQAIGGQGAVDRLVDGLYDRIELDTLLRPAFNRDLVRERERQKLFFAAWFGGRQSYFDAAWPPGIKEVHVPVSISRNMADRWLGHFFSAFTAAVDDPTLINAVKQPITRLALGLVNRANEPIAGERLRDVGDPRFIPTVVRNDAAGLAALAAERPQVFAMHGPRMLLVAAIRDKSDAAEELLRQGVNVNALALPPGGDAKLHGLPMLRMTPLCGALAVHRDALARLLVRRGAQYDIFTAAFVGDLNAVRELLDLAPALADAQDPGCDVARITPLLHAVSTGRVDVARLLLQRGAAVGDNSARLLRTAANRGDEALIDLLLGHGANPASIGAGSWVTHSEIAPKLLARGANVNQEPGAWIGLSCTGNSGHQENVALVRALLRCGADVAARYKGRSALHCAAKAGFVNVVKILIEHGGDVNALSDQGRTPLQEVGDAGKSVDKAAMRRVLRAHGAREGK